MSDPSKKSIGRERTTQKTKPKTGKPVEIPVPERGEVQRDLARIAKSRKPPPTE